MAFGKATPGAPFITSPLGSATVINDLMDMRDWYKRSIKTGARSNHSPIPTDIIKVKNISGADRSAGQVLELGDFFLNELERRHIWFEAGTCSHPVGRTYAILHRPIPTGEIDDASISGVCVARVNILSTSDRYAHVELSSNVLKSGKAGQFKILGPLTSTGEQDCAVVFDDSRPLRLCKPVNDIAKGASGSITLYEFNGTTEASGSTVTAKALMAAVTGGASPKWCSAWWDGTWYVVPGEC